MPHHSPLIATIVVGLVLAFALGGIAHRLRISPIVGYLIAGVIVGPHTPGFIADQALAGELAEIGIILLMFGVGLHFSFKDLLSVRSVAVPGALAQITFTTLLGTALGLAMGWRVEAGIVFGLALSAASTVVLIRSLQEHRLFETHRGRIAVGWLVIEDLVMILALVLLPAFAGLSQPGGPSLARFVPVVSELPLVALVLLETAVKIGAFIGLMTLIGRRAIPWLLHQVAHSGSRELFRLAVLAISLGVAYGCAQLFDVSFALGAFFAGMILSESALSQQAAEESLPLRDAFAVLFFVSVGMLFDPTPLWRDPLPVLGTVAIVMLANSLAAFGMAWALGQPLATALVLGASLAQIGEFAFILGAMGISVGVLPPEGRDLIIAGALISIVANPTLFAIVDRYNARQAAAHLPEVPPASGASEPPEPTALRDHAIIVGYGRVGRLVSEALDTAGVPQVVIEMREKAIAEPRAGELEVIVGNAADPEVLALANPAGARTLFIAIPEAFEAGQIVQQARALNPQLEILARAHFEAEIGHLRTLGADVVIMGEQEIAKAMVAHLPQAPPARSTAAAV
jgi:CPA2 family monovalent cation:H+ antiporter-2